MAQRIVVWSRAEDFQVGETFDQGSVEWHEVRGEVVTLPIDEHALNPDAPAVCGYYRRDLGGGPFLREMRPTRAVPMLLWVVPGLLFLHYAVRIDFDLEQTKIGRPPRGKIWLAPGSPAHGGFAGGLSAVGVKEILLDDLAVGGIGSHVLKGRTGIVVQEAGYFSCILQAVAEGVRIGWAAVTQSARES